MLTQDSLALIRNDNSASCVFTAPTELPDDPATLQAILRAALAEIEWQRLQLAGLKPASAGDRHPRQLRK